MTGPTKKAREAASNRVGKSGAMRRGKHARHLAVRRPSRRCLPAWERSIEGSGSLVYELVTRCPRRGAVLERVELPLNASRTVIALALRAARYRLRGRTESALLLAAQAFACHASDDPQLALF